MTPKKLTAFRLGPIDLRRLEKLALKKECSRSAIVRESLKLMAEREGVK
jgi:predicted transcriptional regulator